MRSLSKPGLVAVAIGVLLSLPVVACSLADEDASSSASDFSARGPGNGRRPTGPVILADAGPPGLTAVSDASSEASASADGGAEDDGEAPPPTDEDGGSGEPPPADDDAGS